MNVLGRFYRTSAVWALLGIAFTAQRASLRAQTPPPIVPVEARGPAVGSKIPEFRLQDQTGQWRDLPSLRGRNGIILLFVRSADW